MYVCMLMVISKMSSLQKNKTSSNGKNSQRWARVPEIPLRPAACPGSSSLPLRSMFPLSLHCAGAFIPVLGTLF